MKGVIYLAGGGNEFQSAKFDELFLGDLKSRGISRLAYIPVALNPERFAQAEKWFGKVFGGKNLEIEVLTNLQQAPPIEPNRVGVYIGGGDTLRLLKEMRKSAFGNKLRKFLQDGGVIYGGSAGAIVLGFDIRAAPEARSVKPPTSRGLNFLNGYSVICHFKRTPQEIESCKKLRVELGKPLVAISEQGGVIVRQNEIRAIDKEEVTFF